MSWDLAGFFLIGNDGRAEGKIQPKEKELFEVSSLSCTRFWSFTCISWKKPPLLEERIQMARGFNGFKFQPWVAPSLLCSSLTRPLLSASVPPATTNIANSLDKVTYVHLKNSDNIQTPWPTNIQNVYNENPRQNPQCHSPKLKYGPIRRHSRGGMVRFPWKQWSLYYQSKQCTIIFGKSLKNVPQICIKFDSPKKTGSISWPLWNDVNFVMALNHFSEPPRYPHDARHFDAPFGSSGSQTSGKAHHPTATNGCMEGPKNSWAERKKGGTPLQYK